jgi:tetratricopeptide (TPR) repeat protein
MEPIGEGSPGSTIEAAQQKVRAEPDNPDAYLELAAAYWEAGMFDEANRTFEAGFERSKSDPKYLIQAGDFMRERELWLEAAKFYGEAMKLIPVKPPPELQEYYEMSLYLGADDPALEEVLLELPKGRVELVFIEIVRARHSLYQGEMTRVKVITRRLNEKQSDRRELKLLEAEIFHAQGNDELASEKLEGLLNDPAAPRWVRLVAQHILEEVIP